VALDIFCVMTNDVMPRLKALPLWKRLGESLRFQLLLWIVLPLIGVICVNLLISFQSAEATADLINDQMLLSSARVIAEAVTVDNSGTIEADIPPAALEMFDTGHGDRVFYRVITAWGTLVAGFLDLPSPKKEQAGEDAVFRGDKVRVMMLNHPVVGLAKDAAVSVSVAVTLNNESAMRQKLWLSDFTKQLLLVLVAGLVAVIGLQRGLAPVLRLRDAVRQRDRERLDPFNPQTVQSELRPLVHALNDHMERVQGQMAAQRRFVSNAAHQLRTPLALVNTQASVAAREENPERRNEALQALRTSTKQLTRLASQLLTLSRAEPGSRRPRHDTVDLAAAARQVLETYAETALRRQIDLGLEASEASFVEGDGAMLSEMLVNLVDNALRYTPVGGTVTVSLSQQGEWVCIRVEDNGPGIPESEHEHVFERFYRIMGTQAEGSGLGLAIVKEVVDGASGDVTLKTPPNGGLIVEVRLPAA
jgi:two-component system, OmpR family, sensor histidine kinase TctE